MYNFAIFLYRIAVGIASLFYPKAKKWLAGRKNLFETIEQTIDPQHRTIWFHAASLGEFEQGRPVLEAIKKHYPDHKILLTFFSPSGYEMRKEYPQADYVFYLPLDTPSNARRFVNLTKPDKVFFIKYEFWKNILNELHKRQIPTYLISGSFYSEQLFFKPYGKSYRRILNYFTHFFVQDDNSQQLLQHIGYPNVTITGDTRLDRVSQIASQAKPLPLLETFTNQSQILVAGSTWPPDEEILATYYQQNPTKIRLIIAPHEVHEDHLKRIEKRFGDQTLRYSKATPQKIKQAQVLLIDSIGLLASLYQYGQIAYIGGGFGAGIHNTPEAAVYGMPVVFGPKYTRFREAVDLIEAKGAFSIKNTEEFAQLTDKLLADKAFRQKSGEAARQYIEKNKGATQKIIDALQHSP